MSVRENDNCIYHVPNGDAMNQSIFTGRQEELSLLSALLKKKSAHIIPIVEYCT